MIIFIKEMFVNGIKYPNPRVHRLDMNYKHCGVYFWEYRVSSLQYWSVTQYPKNIKLQIHFTIESLVPECTRPESRDNLQPFLQKIKPKISFSNIVWHLTIWQNLSYNGRIVYEITLKCWSIYRVHQISFFFWKML